MDYAVWVKKTPQSGGDYDAVIELLPVPGGVCFGQEH